MNCRSRAVKLHASAAILLAAALLARSAAAARHKPAEAPPPMRTSQPPAWTIPAGPLGFAPPGEIYLGARYSLVSLDFLDEDRLLFTFRVPGLFRRDPTGLPGETERHIRAVVLHIPDGAVQAEALWTLHDYGRYLYMLDGGKFAVRDRGTLSLSDGSLLLTPWLTFPGPLLYVEFDPSRQHVVTESSEPAAVRPSSGDSPGPATAHASISTGETATDSQKTETILRILRRSSGEVILLNRVRTAVHIPFNGDGYLEPLRSRSNTWLVQFNAFTGGNSRAGTVESTCAPRLDFVASREYLATACGPSGAQWLVAATLEGRRLWERSEGSNTVWPLLAQSRSGTRLIRETLQTTHVVNAIAPLSGDDITKQEVAILDSATGKEVLRAQASPIFDAGGNAALSPSGRRAAILIEGGIQVFELPEAPPIPAPQP